MEEAPKDKVSSIEDYVVLKEFKDVFREIPGFPLKKDIDFSINLMLGGTPKYKTPYMMSTPELKELQMHLEDILKKGYTHPSVSPCGAPILFVNKKYGILRLCINFMQLNKVIVKSKYPLPRIDDIFLSVQRRKYILEDQPHIKIPQVGIKEEDIIKTTFRTRYGHYEFTMVPFGLSNAPTAFMHLMNGIFINSLDKFIIVFLNGILIYSKFEEEHDKHLRMVLQVLRTHQLYAKLSKCSFYQRQIHYLGHIISEEGIVMDPEKIKSIEGWTIPKNISKVTSFMGLMGYYRRFIEGF
jgi:hypothetical protein